NGWQCVVVVGAVSQPCSNTVQLDTEWVTDTFTNAHTGYCPKGLVVVLFVCALAEADSHEVVSQTDGLTTGVVGVWYAEATWAGTGEVRNSGVVAGSPCTFQDATVAVRDLQGWGDFDAGALFDWEVSGASQFVGCNTGGPHQRIGVEGASIRLVCH